MQIHNKLAELQNGLKPRYKDFEEFQKAIRKLCKKHGCVMYSTSDIVDRCGTAYTRVEVMIADTDSDGFHQLSASGYSIGYVEARNKAIKGLFGVEVSIDTSNAKMPVNPAQNDVETAELKHKVISYIKKVKMSEENIKKICIAYNIDKIEDMTAENCKKYLNYLEKIGVEQ